ncbi:MAG TPA: glycosyltransferase family 2 protein [Chthoniobacteraceae bacterium]|jgi:glycosyltransferase involved in cell wall biosynthesis|nr:glycosyltransferase family 2 protein [Chthoniobacteraceae bacterium]
MEISAYIPCHNGAATLQRAIEGVRRQPVAEFFVVDDGSTDGSAKIAEAAGVRVIRLDRRTGRGACRARAMAEARHPVVLSCDAAIFLPPDFVARAVKWIEQENAAAVCGFITQQEARNAVDRWRGRHLLRAPGAFSGQGSFVTAAALLRADLAAEAGGYDAGHEHGEDADLGRRLLARGRKVIYDPELIAWQIGSNSMGRVLERYWRWNRAGGRLTFARYIKQIHFAVTVMARQDMETADVGAALISLVSPHYQYWRDLWE